MIASCRENFIQTDPSNFDVAETGSTSSPLLSTPTQVTMTQAPLTPTSTGTTPENKSSLDNFPLAEGNTWIYSYSHYTQSVDDPKEILTATYILTETVTSNVWEPPYTFVKIEKDAHLVSDEPLPSPGLNLPLWDQWYIIQDSLVYEQQIEPVAGSFNPYDSRLAFDFPLSVGNNWCPITSDPDESDDPEVLFCEANGMHTVVEHRTYDTPAGSFENCYYFVEFYNSGSVHRWFCTGVGVVNTFYHHSGTRFGFEQTLMDYSLKSP